jgi:hypothetical protein
MALTVISAIETLRHIAPQMILAHSEQRAPALEQERREKGAEHQRRADLHRGSRSRARCTASAVAVQATWFASSLALNGAGTLWAWRTLTVTGMPGRMLCVTMQKS